MIIQGIVVKGKGRGRALGFPTANISFLNENSQIPIDQIEYGVYASIIEVDENFYHSVTSIGKNETFGEKEATIETYIFNFNKDIYGKRISLSLISKIRDMKKFKNTKLLKEAIKQDIKKAKAILYQALRFNF